MLIEEDVAIAHSDYSDDLAHYGVLGQKWGVRKQTRNSLMDAKRKSDTAKDRAPKSGGSSKADAKWEKKGRRSLNKKEYRRGANRAIDTLNAALPGINEKTVYQSYIGKGGNLQDGSPTSIKYNNEVNKVWQDSLAKETKSARSSPSGDKEFELLTGGPKGWDVQVVNAKHSADQNGSLKVKVDSSGLITSIKLAVNADLSHLSKTNDEYIAHYGVLGQKWGVRNQKRKDEAAARSERITNMSDGDMKAAVARINLEKQYSQLTETESTKYGKKFTDRAKDKMTKKAADAFSDKVFSLMATAVASGVALKVGELAIKKVTGGQF